ncbi:MAG TPA: DUF1761 domain-containing protein [Candidatus Nanoarchaeia archaeon]|nr:DUF1761 domain-containing protein [Candidatus Nanoarchaeia archaeon]
MNYLAILLAAIVSMILGCIWYAPSVFGTQWMKLAGINPKQAKKGSMAPKMVIAFIASIVTAYVLARIAGIMGATTFSDALNLAFWVWLGFVGTTSLGSVLWEGKPTQLWWLNNAHNFINLLLAATIITLWV